MRHPDSVVLRCGALALAAVFAATGCGREATGPGQPPDDEAMLRARFEHRTAEQAAQDYFLPKYYADPYSGDLTVPNYLRGMDIVAVSPKAIPSSHEGMINTLDTPVFQLLDKERPDFVFADAVESNSEILGRNTWMLWCAGNEGFWDWLATDSLGFIDLLKLIDTRSRGDRFRDSGLINEPGTTASGSTDEFGIWLDTPIDLETRKWRQAYLRNAFEAIRDRRHPSQRGLFNYDDGRYGREVTQYKNADSSMPGYGDGYENSYEELRKEARKYPPPGIYGISSGVVGLRLFPNPRFDAEARKKWNPDRYYTDEDYAADPNLIRPYRVGMACAFCHASFHPLNPPRDVVNPGWENISGNIGAQYLRPRAALGNLLKPDNFVYHLLDSQPPGTIDTSLIASDNINNPNAMNSVFALPQRVLLSLRNPAETISPDSASLPSLWRSPQSSPPPDASDVVPEFWRSAFRSQGLTSGLETSNSHPSRHVPRILFDGADSIGGWGALARVYLNIGTYYEQWIRLHRTVVGFKPQSPFTISDCEHHSVYWHATQARVAALRDYFLKATPAMPLAAAAVGNRLADQVAGERNASAPVDSPEVKKTIDERIGSRIDRDKLRHGRKVFANNCIVCHSSIQPESSVESVYQPGPERVRHAERYAELIEARKKSREDGARLGEFWEHDPGQWLRNRDYLDWAEEVVEQKDFWRLNFLSIDSRIPITLVQTNAARAMATNALEHSMWDDFTSESYQHLPSVGAIDFFNPYLGDKGATDKFVPRHKVASDVPPAGGGPGFYRVPTLVSIWATAPLLHNNSLGRFTNDPSIDGRLRAFDDGIRKLLWPERRLESTFFDGPSKAQLADDRGLIWRTSRESYLTLSGPRVPEILSTEIPALMKIRDSYRWLEQIRPIWLPSAILLLSAFLLLVVDSPEKRRRLGWLLILVAALAFLLSWLHSRNGWFAALDHIAPAWLPGVLLLWSGLVLLALDCPRRLRIIAYSLLLVALIGLALTWLDPGWAWLNLTRRVVSIGGVSLAIASFAVLLLIVRTRWRYYIAFAALALAVLGIFVYLHDAWLSAYRWSDSIGPVWSYSFLLVAAAVVLLTPDLRELSRYTGYATLILALSVGGWIYFFSGKLGEVRIGPIPKGTPVNLLANINPDADPAELTQALKIALTTFAEIESKQLDDVAQQKLLREKVAPALMKVSKCPDFVMDHGHYFAWFQDMSDKDKESLIELLKTF